MPITPQFDIDAVRAYAYKQKDEFIKAGIEAYKRACINMVKRAKQTKTYKDQTHALRSSIGCVLYHNGEEVFNYFESTGGESGGAGVETGLGYARDKAAEAGNESIVAVVVAGMQYARAVEAKGKDVLTGSTRQFASDLKSSFGEVKDALSEHIIAKMNSDAGLG